MSIRIEKDGEFKFDGCDKQIFDALTLTQKRFCQRLVHVEKQHCESNAKEEFEKYVHALNEIAYNKSLRIRKVIFDGPATIVFWSDGEKTVVKCTDGDVMNYEMGIAMATLKKLLGDGYSRYKKSMKETIEDSKKKEIAKERKEKETIDK